MICKPKNPAVAAPLFAGCTDTSVFSCLQGVLGAVYTDREDDPQSAMAIINVFAFFGGKPNAELVRFRPENYKSDFVFAVPLRREWETLIEREWKDAAQKVTRYAIKKEKDVFDPDKLQKLAAVLPADCSLQLIDEALYTQCLQHSWSKDFVCTYPDYETFAKIGLGVVAVKNGEIIAGASSFSSYDEGIEIEIATREDCRRQGLATACGARLILECLQRNLYPSWDAANTMSVGLSAKLGYHFSHEYTAYKICPYV